MQDWNKDGKHDQKDVDFYYNNIDDDGKNKENRSEEEYSSGNPSSNVWVVIVFVICLVYVFIKLISQR
ncbi:MAG: hypothetical protein ACI4QL_00785 [Candidatus Fimimonas sp.]